MQILEHDTKSHDQVTLLDAPADIVERELKGTATEADINWLNLHTDIWRNELLIMKKAAETQFSFSKSRIASKYAELCLCTTDEDYNNKLYEYNKLRHTEEQRRPGAIKFLSSLEIKLFQLRGQNLPSLMESTYGSN